MHEYRKRRVAYVFGLEFSISPQFERSTLNQEEMEIVCSSIDVLVVLIANMIEAKSIRAIALIQWM